MARTMFVEGGIELLTQEQVDILLSLIKVLTQSDDIVFPDPGERKLLELRSEDSSETFVIDVYHGRINVNKVTYQTRYKNIYRLLRVDIEGSPHPNPDGQVIPCPHIHIYKEGFDDSWAYPLDEKINTDHTDLLQVLSDFLEYNNVAERPQITYQKGGLV